MSDIGPGWRLNHFPGQPVPMLDNPLGEEKFPNIQSKPPLAQLEAISSRPIPCYLGEETDPHLSTPSFQAVVESDEVSPQPPFLQAKQSQLPQPLLIRLLLQTLHQLRCPSLYALQYLNIPLVVGGPKLNTVFEAAFQPLFPKPVALHGVAVAQVQDLALGLVKPHTIHPSPSIQPVQVPLQSLPTLQQINTPTQLGVVCKLTESALDPFIQIIDKDVKQNWPQHRALGNTACDRLAEQPQVPQPLPISLVLQTLPQLRCPSLDTLQPLNVSLGVRGPKLNTGFEAEQPQLSQPVLVGEVLQPSDHFCGPPLDPLQQVHVFPVLRAPELDAALQGQVVTSEQTANQAKPRAKCGGVGHYNHSSRRIKSSLGALDGWKETGWELDSWVSSTALLDSHSSMDFGRQVQSALASSQLPTIPWPPSPKAACRETAFPCECNQQGSCEATSQYGQHFPSYTLDLDSHHAHGYPVREDKVITRPLQVLPGAVMQCHRGSQAPGTCRAAGEFGVEGSKQAGPGLEVLMTQRGMAGLLLLRRNVVFIQQRAHLVPEDLTAYQTLGKAKWNSRAIDVAINYAHSRSLKASSKLIPGVMTREPRLSMAVDGAEDLGAYQEALANPYPPWFFPSFPSPPVGFGLEDPSWTKKPNKGFGLQQSYTESTVQPGSLSDLLAPEMLG
ncbi:hypothetical protein QYF61_027116 [Mycteria americana]|uniref:Uncharacterized protein n=1 Tax=Mycteria americana TaxID=33587 RepID=A0AAN7S5M1_MYCAM|nr:hypothetical protein QYF61_027116 [Mycteria americana]